MSGSWMIYGANGYTGELAAREAVARGLRPVLAGRNAAAVRRAGARARSSTAAPSPSTIRPRRRARHRRHDRRAPLRRPVRAHQQADGRGLPGGAAPTISTSPARSRSSSRSWPAAARRGSAGVALLPGVGFDVVPSDCLAARLAARPAGRHRARPRLRLGPRRASAAAP